MIAGLRELGKTVVLTTHYLEEAQELADRVAIVKAGEIVAEGPPQALIDANREVHAVMAAWGLAGLVLAVRFFVWTPRHQAS